jgi:hypothetical protein
MSTSAARTPGAIVLALPHTKVAAPRSISSHTSSWRCSISCCTYRHPSSSRPGLGIAPVLGVRHAREHRVLWRLMVALDHVLYGIVVAGRPTRP